jgi:hypothetical protein
MHANGHTTVWGTHTGVGRTRHVKSWYQQLRDWWMTRKAARREANLALLRACWDGKHETVRSSRAEAAPEMAAAQHALFITTMIYGLNQ